MTSKHTILIAVVLSGIQQGTPDVSWPQMGVRDLANTVFVIHELSGDAVIVRNGKRFEIRPFNYLGRQRAKASPQRLAVLNGDQFWLKENAWAKISYVTEDGGSIRSEVTTIGKDHREEGRTFYKNRTPLSTSAIEQLRLMVRLGQNSKPLEDGQEPRIMLPVRDEIVASGKFTYQLQSKSLNDWTEVAIVYPLSSGELEIWRGKASTAGSIPISRSLVLQKLHSHFGSSDDWASSEIGLRIVARGVSSIRYFQDFYLAAPEREKEMLAARVSLDALLKEKPSLECEIKLTALCAKLSDCPSLVLDALKGYRADEFVANLEETIRDRWLAP
jgi:hypothetical protein